MISHEISIALLLDDVSSVIGLHGALKFNGGGHLNHSIFWQVRSMFCRGEAIAVKSEIMEHSSS